MKSIDIDTVLTIIFVLVDDWCKKNDKRVRRSRPGRKPEFVDSEVLTLMLASEFVPYPGELQFMAYIRANHLGLFPKLLCQSQFNRRARRVRGHLEVMRQAWLQESGLTTGDYFLLDTKPIPVVGYKRSKKRSDFAGSGAYGYCSSREFYYFGYKLVLLTSLSGVPIAYDLVPANTDERQAAETVLTYLSNADVIGDKGFIGAEWQAKILAQTGNRILTPKRKNQKIQHPDGLERLLNTVRERIEGAFHEIQNTGRHIERLLAKTIVGLATRIAIKMTAHLLKLRLRSHHGIDVQTFQMHSDFAL